MEKRNNCMVQHKTETVLVYYNAEDRNIIESGIFYDITAEDVEREIESYNLLVYLPLAVHGKTYAEKKECLFNLAVMWSYAGAVANWSYGEIAEIQSFFEVFGKRFGLIQEFRENGIC